MSNAYNLSVPLKKSIRRVSTSNTTSTQYDDKLSFLFTNTGGAGEEEKRGSVDDMNQTSNTLNNTATITRTDGGTRTIIQKTLKNGEKRYYISTQERELRLNLLRKYGLLSTSSSPSRESRQKERAEPKHSSGGVNDSYEEEFEHYNNDNDDGAHGEGKAGDSKQDSTSATRGGSGSRSCEYVQWSYEDRKKGLRLLEKESSTLRQEKQLQALMTEGKPPSIPLLVATPGQALLTTSTSTSTSVKTPTKQRRMYESESKDGRADSRAVDDTKAATASTVVTTSTLQLQWTASNKQDHISFYSIEYGGPSTGILRSERYQEIYRDPPNASPDSIFTYTYTLTNLQPATTYCFRVRAYNGFGPSEYVYKTFTTLCEKPAKPQIISTSETTLVLRWLFNDDYNIHIIELKRIYDSIDTDHSGSVDRVEFMNALYTNCIDSKELRVFMMKVLNSQGIIELTYQSLGSLFDMIECDDDGTLSWEEFRQYLLSSGWLGATLSVGPAGAMGSMGQSKDRTGGQTPLDRSRPPSRASTPRRVPSSSAITLKPDPLSPNRSTPRGTLTTSSPVAAAILNSGSVNNKNITYVIEQCESELNEVYKEVLKTTLGTCTVARLEPGKSYRFRVYGINTEGKAGPVSESIVAHTMIETPSTPTAILIQPRKITIQWYSRTQYTNTRSKAVVDKLMTDWAGLHHLMEGGVSVESAFQKYDRDGNGYIDSKEIAYLLTDLGIPVTTEKISDIMRELDIDNNGTISFDEFAVWWRKSDVIYTIKRSHPILPTLPLDTTASMMLTSTNKYTPRTEMTLKLQGSIKEDMQSSIQSDINRNNTYTEGNIQSSNIHAEDREREYTQKERYDDDDIFAHLDVLSLKPKTPNNKIPMLNTNTHLLEKPPRYNDVTIAMTKLLNKTATNKLIVPSQVPVPIVSYRGEKTRCDLAGLLPNRLYHIRLRYSGSRSSSILSPPLAIITAPLPVPEEPLLVAYTSNTIRIKWYPPVYGAYRYEVQLRKATNKEYTNTNNNNTTGMYTGRNDGTWSVVYTGQENIYVNTTMTPDTTYDICVYCINYQGIYSDPSPILTLTTPPRTNSTTNTTSTTPTPTGGSLSGNSIHSNTTTAGGGGGGGGGRSKNQALYSIECTGDIAIGDTILLTERMYASKTSYNNTPRGGASSYNAYKSVNESQLQDQIRKVCYSI